MSKNEASQLKVIVLGGINVDIIASGIQSLPTPGNHTYAQNLEIKAGGKSRNVAEMLANLTPAHSVAMVGRTAQDNYGLWRVPLDALRSVGVDTEFVVVDEHASKMPGVALISVDTKGQNEIVVISGANNDLTASDVDQAKPLFELVGKNKGALCLSLESKTEVVTYAARVAAELGIQVVLDAGGAKKEQDYSSLLNNNITLIKPNEHETQLLTGILVADEITAKAATDIFHQKGISNVLITLGEKGAFLSTPELFEHIPLPSVITETPSKDETGCGDQTLAGLVASLQDGFSILESAHRAVMAGTLQFYKSGVEPITHAEWDQAIQANTIPN